MKSRSEKILLIATLAAGAILVGVGFATWLIANSETANAGGNVSAETVTATGEKIEVSADGNISFSAPHSAEKGWLTENGADHIDENLTATFTLKITGAKQIDYDWYVGKTADAVTRAEGWNSAVRYGFVSNEIKVVLDGPDKEQYTLDEAAHTLTATETADMGAQYTVTLTVTFAWGTHFGNKNPYTYYNGHEQNDTREGGYLNEETFTSEPDREVTYGEDAYASLNELGRLLDGLHYIFTFTASSNGSN